MHFFWNTYHKLTNQIHQLDQHIGELIMTVNTDAQHLSDDVAALGTAIGTALAELKAQIAAISPPVKLDFTALDALVASTQAEAAADAPVAPPAG
jgi:hypothetical protein